MKLFYRGLVAVAATTIAAGLSFTSIASAAEAMGKDHMHKGSVVKKDGMQKGATHKNAMSK